MKLVVADGAKSDLQGISDYTRREWGERQKVRYMRALGDVFKRIGRNPKLGAIRDDLSLDYRSLPVGGHIIFFRVLDDRVEIVRVLHGHMDPQRHLAEKS